MSGVLSFKIGPSTSGLADHAIYLPGAKQLILTFRHKSGKVSRYMYHEVPGEAFENFRRDVSKGKFLTVIKKNYRVEKLPEMKD